MHNRGSLDLSNRKEDIQRFREAVDVLATAQQLGVILFQFPPWFIHHPPHVEYVEQLRSHFADVGVAIEFRHRSWWTSLERVKTLEWLKQLKAVNVVCDEPQVGNGCIPFVGDVTQQTCTVFRLHGRNEPMWYQSGLKSSQERFDYHYTKQELAQFVPYVEKWAQESNQVHILMNNNSGNDAITGALDWLELLDLPRRERPTLTQTKQLSLFDEF